MAPPVRGKLAPSGKPPREAWGLIRGGQKGVNYGHELSLGSRDFWDDGFSLGSCVFGSDGFHNDGKKGGEKMTEDDRIQKRIEMYAKWSRVKLFNLMIDLLEQAKVWPVSSKETNFWRLNRLTLATIAVALGA